MQSLDDLRPSPRPSQHKLPALLCAQLSRRTQLLTMPLSRHGQFLALLLIAALWFCSTPYYGIWHDGNLYALQALNRLQPHNYAKEFFFAFGSQDNFTIFSVPYSILIKTFGLSTGGLLMFYICQTFWIFGAIRLFRQLLPELLAYFGLALMLVTRHHYGGFNIFAYGESFVSARLAAEAISLWAISFSVQNRHLPALGLAALSIFFHPLIGVWSLLLSVLGYVGTRWSARLIILGSLLALLPILGGIGPTRLTAEFDPAWYHLLHDGQLPYLFLDTWSIQNMLQTVITALSILCAALFSTSDLKVFWRTLFMLLVATLALTYIGTAYSHNILIAQLQPWRILWISQLLQWAAIISCFAKRKVLLPLVLLIMSLVISYLSKDLKGHYFYAYPATVLVFVTIFWINTPRLFESLRKRIGSAIAPIIAPAAITIAVALLGWRWIEQFGIYLYDNNVIKGYIFFNVFPSIAFCLIFSAFYFFPLKYLKYLCCMVVALLIGIGALFVDARKHLEISEMGCTGMPDCVNDAKKLIKPGSLVFWEDEDGISGTQSAWFYAETANYVSTLQSASRTFSRDLSLLDERRRRILNNLPLRADDSAKLGKKWRMDAEFTEQDKHDFRKPLNAKGIVRLCSDQDLDYIVTELNLPDFNPQLIDTKPPQRVYDCKIVRQNAPIVLIASNQAATSPSSTK